MDEEDSKASRNLCMPPYRKSDEMKVEGFPFEPWHSTPVKKHVDETSMARQTARSPQTSRYHASSMSLMQGSKIPACEMENITIHKQRLELQLLIAELKDRDQELNSMATAHHRQVQAWEQDRQRVLTLEQKCARLEDELRKRNEVIRALSKRVKFVEAREKDRYREVSCTQQQLHELHQRQQHSSQQQQDLEEKNRSMNSTIMTLSSQVGQLQVHEEELGSMLKLKDKDLMEATNRILELTNQLRESDATLKESQTRESKMLRETEEHKHRFRETKYDIARLKDELQEKTMENNGQREELIRLKQENQLLRKELALAGEGESWKDELLGLARSKQERTESELVCLRQVCMNQQNDLQLLKLNLETTREALRQYEGQRSLERVDNVAGTSCVSAHHPGTEIGEYMQGQCHDSDTHPLPPSHIVRKPPHRDTAEPSTENSASSATPSGDIPASWNTIPGDRREEESRGSNHGPVSGTDSAGPCAEPGPVLIRYCECSSSTAEMESSYRAGCRAGHEVGNRAVINHDAETDTAVLLVDIGPTDPQCSCPGSVTCFYVDCSTPSPQRRRSPDPTEDAAFNNIANGNQGECMSSTSRLQRLLAESRQMVASLEHTSGKPLSPASSPTSESDCSLHGSYSHSHSRNHSLSPRNTQEESQQRSNDDTQIHNQHLNPRIKECGQ